MENGLYSVFSMRMALFAGGFIEGGLVSRPFEVWAAGEGWPGKACRPLWRTFEPPRWS